MNHTFNPFCIFFILPIGTITHWKFCTVIWKPLSRAGFAALVRKPLGITSTRVPAFFFFFLRVNALNYAGVNERTEEKAGVGSPSAPSEGDKAYSSAAALSALGRAQIKRGLGGVKKEAEHKAYMLMY